MNMDARQTWDGKSVKNMDVLMLQERQRRVVEAEVMWMVEKHNRIVSFKKQKSLKKYQITEISCEAVEKTTCPQTNKRRLVSTVCFCT